MADNGHCSVCQTHNTKSTCGGKIESFKNLFGTKVSENEAYLKLNADMPNVQNEQTITEDIFDQFKILLQAIKDYGELAEDNPNQNKINSLGVNKNDIIYLNDYNKILLALDKDTLSGSHFITKDLIDTLQEYITKYNINDARCNICNTKCQNCQSDCDNNCNCSNCDCNCSNCYYENYIGAWGTYSGGGYIGGYSGGVPCYYSGSKRELKENIDIFNQSALELIKEIQIVNFNYKEDKDKNYKVGFIADDTNEIFSTKNHDCMDIYNCIGILLKAVQELSLYINK